MTPGYNLAQKQKTLENIAFSRVVDSTPGMIRTCDPRIRNPLLYPTELQGQCTFRWDLSVFATHPKWRISVA